MESAIAKKRFRKCIILFIVGIGCISLMFMININDPITMILKYNLEMSPHSLLFSIWKKPPLDMYLNVYIFNITNPEEFLSGKEKLKVQEIGPYVYQELLVNENITYNDNDTLTYIPRRTIVYVPEMSIGDPTEDIVNVANAPFLGASSAMSDAGFMVNFPLTQLTNLLGTKPILNISVHDYLWGYEDLFVRLASGIIPNFINFQKFGFLDRIYDEGENIVTIMLKKKAYMIKEEGRYLSIDKYNGSPGMAQWGYIETDDNETQKENTVCNTLQGATEGIVFPSFIDKHAIFRVFRKAYCRPLPIKFREEVWVNKFGLPGYLYTLMDNFADPPDQNSDNECYCRKRKTCLKKGLSDVTPCYYNIPIALSLPHFLNADPSLLENVIGLNPDQEKHKSYIILQQTVGMPIVFHSRMQTNLIMQHTRHNSKIEAFNNNTVPLFWFDFHTSSLPTYLLIILKMILQILPVVQKILVYIFGIIGMTTLVLSLILLCRLIQQQHQEQGIINSIGNPELRISLCGGQQDRAQTHSRLAATSRFLESLVIKKRQRRIHKAPNFHLRPLRADFAGSQGSQILELPCSNQAKAF